MCFKDFLSTVFSSNSSVMSSLCAAKVTCIAETMQAVTKTTDKRNVRNTLCYPISSLCCVWLLCPYLNSEFTKYSSSRLLFLVFNFTKKVSKYLHYAGNALILQFCTPKHLEMTSKLCV